MSVSTELSIEEKIRNKIPGADTGIQVEKTICSICSNNCGIDAYVKDGVVVKVEGTAENEFSKGTLCAKGNAIRQYVYHRDRLRTPLLRKGKAGNRDLKPVSWEEALDTIATRLLKISEETGPESVAFFVGFPKWQRAFVKRLAHSFGSPNFCTESSTCYYATELANRLNYGYSAAADIDDSTQCLLVWSSNPFHSSTPKAKGLLAAVKKGMKVIEVGPLITPVTAHATLHLRIRPGTSGALALGFAHVIIAEKLYAADFVETYTTGFDEFAAYVKEFTPHHVAEVTGVPSSLLIKAARLYARSKPAAMLNGACPTVHHTNGTQNHRAITALIGLTGNFDRKGGNYVVPWSYYHAPNGLKTRDKEFAQVRPWEQMAPRIGHDVHSVWDSVIQEGQAMHLPAQIRSGKPYPIRAIVGFGLNHRMWPGSDMTRECLKQLDLFVAVDLFRTETSRLADVVLPACSTFERHQLKMYPGRYSMWTEPIIPAIGQSRSDIDIICDLSAKLNLDDPLLKKGYKACVDWILEPSGVQVADLETCPGGTRLQVGEMPPYQKYKLSGFPTTSGKMEFSSSILAKAGHHPLPVYQEPKRSPFSSPELFRDYPLILTTGSRLPMFFHSRTFRLGWIHELQTEPVVEIHPIDARNRDLLDGDAVSVSTPENSITFTARVTGKVPPGTVNIYHNYPAADVNLLIDPGYRDPISGYPGFKSQLCQVEKR